MNFVFRKRFLKSGVRVEARRAVAHIDVHDAEFAHIQIIHVHGGSHLDSPIDGTERSVPVKQVKGKTKCLAERKLLALAEKIAAAGLRRADVARRRHAALVDEKCPKSP